MPGQLGLEWETATGRQRRPVAAGLRVGRDRGSDIVIRDSRASRTHAVVTAGPNGVVVDASASTNGVVVDGRRLRSVAVAPGGAFELAGTRFRVVVVEAAVPLDRPVASLANRASQLPDERRVPFGVIGLAGVGLLAIVVGVVVAVFATVGDSEPHGEPDLAGLRQADISVAEGGSVALPDGATVTIAGGAVSKDSVLSVAPVEPPQSASDGVVAHRAIDVSLSGGELVGEAVVSFPLVPGEAGVIPAHWNEALGRWEPLPYHLDERGTTISFQTTHFSIFGTVSIPAPPLFAVLLMEGNFFDAARNAFRNCKSFNNGVQVFYFDTSGGLGNLEKPPTPGSEQEDRLYIRACIEKSTSGSIEVDLYNTRLVALNVTERSEGIQSRIGSGDDRRVTLARSQLPVRFVSSVPEHEWMVIIALAIIDAIPGLTDLAVPDSGFILQAEMAGIACFSGAVLEAFAAGTEDGAVEALVACLGNAAAQAALRKGINEALEAAGKAAFSGTFAWAEIAARAGALAARLYAYVQASSAASGVVTIDRLELPTGPIVIETPCPSLQPCPGDDRLTTPPPPRFTSTTVPTERPTEPRPPDRPTVPVETRTPPSPPVPPQVTPSPSPSVPPRATPSPTRSPSPPSPTRSPSPRVTPSPSATVTPPPQRPAAPANVDVRSDIITACPNVAGPCPHAVEITWEDRSSNESGFYIYRGSGRIASVGANSESYSFSVESHSEECFAVSAYNAAGESARVEACIVFTGTYLLDLTLPGGNAYSVGDPFQLCYHLSPENVPFTIRLSRSAPDGSTIVMGTQNDNGIGGGDCVAGTIGEPPGDRWYIGEVFVDGVLVAQDEVFATVRSSGGGGGGGGGSCDRAPSTPSVSLIPGTQTLTWTVADPGGPGCQLVYEVNTFGGENLYTGPETSFTVPAIVCNSGYFVGAANQNFGFHAYTLWPCQQP